MTCLKCVSYMLVKNVLYFIEREQWDPNEWMSKFNRPGSENLLRWTQGPNLMNNFTGKNQETEKAWTRWTTSHTEEAHKTYLQKPLLIHYTRCLCIYLHIDMKHVLSHVLKKVETQQKSLLLFFYSWGFVA